MQDPYIAVNEKTPLPKIQDNVIVRLSQQEAQEKENADADTDENEEISSESKNTDNSIELEGIDAESETSNSDNENVSSNENIKVVDGIEISFIKEDGMYTQLSFLIEGNKVNVIGQFNAPEFEIFLIDIVAYKTKIADIISRQENTSQSI